MTEDNSREPHRYLEVAQRFGSPDEFEALRQIYGTPKALTERHAQIDALIASAKRSDDRWQFLKYLVLGLIGAATLLSTIKGILPAGWPW